MNGINKTQEDIYREALAEYGVESIENILESGKEYTSIRLKNNMGPDLSNMLKTKAQYPRIEDNGKITVSDCEYPKETIIKYHNNNLIFNEIGWDKILKPSFEDKIDREKRVTYI